LTELLGITGEGRRKRERFGKTEFKSDSSNKRKKKKGSAITISQFRTDKPETLRRTRTQTEWHCLDPKGSKLALTITMPLIRAELAYSLLTDSLKKHTKF